MFRQLDQRHGDGLTITLEWEATTGELRIRCEDRHSPEQGFSYPVDPDDAHLAFLHPFALRPASQERHRPETSPGPAHGAAGSRRRRWFRQRREPQPKETVEANDPTEAGDPGVTESDDPGDYTWMWWPGA